MKVTRSDVQEWLKLYGVLLGKEDLADKLFQEQVDKLKAIEDSESTGKTVAFFYINSVGAANVRKSGDYVSKMIELAGGKYIFDALGGGGRQFSVHNEHADGRVLCRCQRCRLYYLQQYH